MSGQKPNLIEVRLMATLFIVLALFPGEAKSNEAVASSVTWGAFVDTYYAYDFNNPANHDRGLTTQPARHNEFNVNLAFLEAKLSDEKVRGRLALQVGTSVQSNYAGEPAVGTISGPSISRHIQEAFAGYRLAENLWLDAGIYFSHIGMESFVSRDNWNYSRSLVADFSPYYQAGVKLAYLPSEAWGFQLHVLNGWQNISESNGSKSLGTQLSFTPNTRASLVYSTLIGNELQGFRHFHDVVFKYSLTESWQAGLQVDLGFQRRNDAGTTAHWNGASLVQRVALTPAVTVAGRVERYFDDQQIVAVTGTPNGFQAWGASLNLDVQLDRRVTWRTELRGFWSRDPVFPAHESPSNRDGFAVTSLSFSI